MFACPECGAKVSPRGHTPGRRVLCQECRTLVEVPYLVRASGARKSSRQGAPAWTWAVLGLVAAVMMTFGAVRIAQSRYHSAREREVTQLEAMADALDRSGQYVRALSAAEEALAQAQKLKLGNRDSLKTRRDRIALHEAEARLAADEASSGNALTENDLTYLAELRARIDSDSALEPIRDRVEARLTEARIEVGKRRLDEADRAAKTSRPNDALAACESVAAIAAELPLDLRPRLLDPVRAVAARVIAQNGVLLTPVEGHFLQGPNSAVQHAQTLHPILVQTLKKRGYLPRPDHSAFLSVWDDAPYRLTTEISEREDGTFFQSPLRNTRIDAHLTLHHADTTAWQANLSARTRIPPPGMKAYEASHLAVSKVRDPVQERKLYDDARAVLSDKLTEVIRNLPAPPSDGLTDRGIPSLR